MRRSHFRQLGLNSWTPGETSDLAHTGEWALLSETVLSDEMGRGVIWGVGGEHLSHLLHPSS